MKYRNIKTGVEIDVNSTMSGVWQPVEAAVPAHGADPETEEPETEAPAEPKPARRKKNGVRKPD